MPVVGVASKLRQPSPVGTKPVHTALPIPSAVRAATSQGYMARQQELRAGEGALGLSCQLSIKSEYRQERVPDGKSRAETEESKICKRLVRTGVWTSSVCWLTVMSHVCFGDMMSLAATEKAGSVRLEKEGVFKTPRQIVSAGPFGPSHIQSCQSAN
ncbi:putative neuron navigator 3 [Scophthalmus maximus]|uniref:Putative neuron navigator 3 n=1 Tax=Scophthalmus maximus TaxID=52904 RepID=A0A2U9B1Z1_SCOMX|nr:putative neuron navigator 3 [Scophthalmus maximus]